MNTVSIIMVTYHTGPSLWLAVDSALAQPECAELIVVNNGNHKGVEFLLSQRARQTPRLKLISGQGNVGFAKACNLGAKNAKGDYILLLNPDCMLQQGGLARALEHVRSSTQFLAGCFLANPDGSEQRGGRRGLLTPTNATFESLGLSMMVPKGQKLNLNNTKMPTGLHEVPAVSGAFMLLPRTFYEKLKGMDEGYFLHMEDMDLCYRVHKAGGKVLCMPDVKVLHFRSTSDVSGALVEKHKATSFIYYLNKHFTEGSHAAFLPALKGGIWLRYYLKRFFNAANRIFESSIYGKEYIARLVLLHRATRFEPQGTALTNKVVLVTGASGQLGLSIVAEALAQGAEVIAITRKTQVRFTHERLYWNERNLETDRRALENAHVDMVVHATNLEYLPTHLAGLCKGGAKRVVAFGCAGILEKVNSKLKGDREKADAYGKLEKEIIATCKANDSEATLFRLTTLYGVGLDQGISRQADIISRYGRLTIDAPAKGMRQPVHVRDVAKTVVASLVNPASFGKIYSLGGPQTMSYRNMLEQLGAYLGKTVKFVRIPYLASALTVIGKVYGLDNINSDTMRQMNRDIIVRSDVAAQELGFAPRKFLEGETGL